jgi:hydroxyacylglutathione hydrolase
VLVTGFDAMATCWVLAPGPGERCIVVDPGRGAAATLPGLLAEHRLTPAAVLISHGHVDHTWDAAEVCDTHGVACYVARLDRHQLADPGSGLSAEFGTWVGGQSFREASTVIELEGDCDLDLAGMGLRVEATPGHTLGSQCFSVTPEGGLAPVLVTGDTLFAQGIGRTDLFGGSYETILRSLGEIFARHGDETLVLPGHGETTTIGRERQLNPWVVELLGSLGSEV